MTTELWAITAYFNWCHYRNKLNNYRDFKDNLTKAKINLLTIECVLGDDCFELHGEDIVCVRTNSALWQKERLLNIALTYLPSECSRVAWLDCDLLFETTSWYDRVMSLLDRYVAIQLFDNVFRQAKGQPFHSPATRIDVGLVAHTYLAGNLASLYKCHPGFAWAARRDAISKTGFYDFGIVGGSDRLMALAWTGQCTADVIQTMTPPKALPYYRSWQEAAFKSVRGDVSYLPGAIYHLWHGEQRDRGYKERHSILYRCDFDPSRDIRLNGDGCWEWSSDKKELHDWVAAYFINRKEDG